MRPRVALLVASENVDDARRNFRRELPAVVSAFDVVNGGFPNSYGDYDAVVISGSPYAVYDDRPWIPRLRSWVRGAVDRRLPTLGVCFGHQLLATALGGTVEPMDEFEVGFHEIHRVHDSALLDGLGEWFTAFTAHRDEVTTLPDDAVRLAGNNFTDVHAFRAGHAFGVQFHPEFDLYTATLVLEERDVREEHIETVMDHLNREHYGEATRVKRLFTNFLDYVAESHPHGSRL
ncbi:type 1 glutamine amidotransferase [Halarchaeum salinum]|uniref:Type 1 glutamine amidotransferase n=1 Tax=Halarchaeum salinum TaxID=489912 RepID=A0AAV3S7X6_9EURY